MEERYYSPQKAAELTSVHLNKLKELCVRGVLPIYTTDLTTGKPDAEPLFRYTTAQYFTCPELRIIPFCELWKEDYYCHCPKDCEHLPNPKGFCGPEAEKWSIAPGIYSIRLEDLIIYERDLSIIENAVCTPLQAEELALKRKHKAAAEYVSKAKAQGLSEGAIRDKLKSDFGLTHVVIHDLIQPHKAQNDKDAKLKAVQRMK